MFSAIKTAFTKTPTPVPPVALTSAGFIASIKMSDLTKSAFISQDGRGQFTANGIKEITKALASPGYLVRLEEGYEDERLERDGMKLQIFYVYKNKEDLKYERAFALVTNSAAHTGRLRVHRNGIYTQNYPDDFARVYWIVASWGAPEVAGGKRQRRTYKKRVKSRKTKRHSR